MKNGAFQIKLNTPKGSVITIYKNPTQQDYETIQRDFKKQFSGAAKDENFSRSAYDEDDNCYAWMSGAAIHDMIVERLQALHGIIAEQTKRSFIESQIYGMVNA